MLLYWSQGSGKKWNKVSINLIPSCTNHVMPHSIGAVGSSRKIELCAVSGIACSVCVYVAVRVFELHEGVVPVGMDFKP